MGKVRMLPLSSQTGGSTEYRGCGTFASSSTLKGDIPIGQKLGQMKKSGLVKKQFVNSAHINPHEVFNVLVEGGAQCCQLIRC